MAANNPLKNERLDKMFGRPDSGEIPAQPEPVTQQEAQAASEPPEKEPEKEPSFQTSFMLPESSLDWLAEQEAKAKSKGGMKAIHKAAIVRSLIEVAKEAGVDLTSCKSLEDMRERIVRAVAELQAKH